jgi:hypothetical protein
LTATEWTGDKFFEECTTELICIQNLSPLRQRYYFLQQHSLSILHFTFFMQTNTNYIEWGKLFVSFVTSIMGIFGSRSPEVRTVEKEVIKVIEKIINIDKDKFETNQRILSAILNNGYSRIARASQETFMPIGPSGAGKSTTLNLFFGGNFVAKKDVVDVTRNFTITPLNNYQVIDSVGFLPTFTNIGKLFILFFHHGFFPDYFLYPASSDRVVDILYLQDVIRAGLVKIVVFPFKASSYYDLLRVLQQVGVPEEAAKRRAMEESVDRSLVNEIERGLTMYQISAHIKAWNGSTPIAMTGSMKTVFLENFFTNGQYKMVSYEDHQKAATEREPVALLRAAMVNAISEISKFGSVNSNGLISSIDDCGFIKG